MSNNVSFIIKLNRRSKKTILSCGGQLKNTFSVAKGNSLYVSPTFGDLDRLENYQNYTSFIEKFFKENAIKPDLVAFDLHPDYLSTKYAHSLNVSEEVGVQHHHAHLASFLIEAKTEGKAIGVTFDGTGLVPGGEQAIKEPWRMAASWLYRIYGRDFLDLRIKFVDEIDRSKWAILNKMIDNKINSPSTSSMGRLFDAVSSLIGVKEKIEYEAQAAIELERIADKGVCDFYKFKIEPEDGIYLIDPSDIFMSIVEDLKGKIATSVISARFHNAVCRMINEVCIKLRDLLGTQQVVLSGGVFLNEYLIEKVRPLLISNGFELLQNDRISVGDPGISVGQALIAGGRG